MRINKSNILSWLKFLVGWPLAILSIIFVIKFVYDQSGDLSISLSEINFFYLTLGIGFFFLYYLLRTIIWKILIESGGHKINLRENTYRFAFSELKRFTPGNIWSFLSRAALYTEKGFDKKLVGISMIADIQLVIIGSGLVSVMAIPWILNSSSELQRNLSSLLPISIILIIIYFLVVGYIYKKKFGQSSSISGSLYLPGFKSEIKLKSALLATLTYFIFGVGNYLVMISLFNVGFGQIFALSSFFTFALLVGYLTFITPMGLGIRELVVTLGLSSIMTSADAGAVSIFTRIILIISELSFLGLIFLWEKKAKK